MKKHSSRAVQPMRNPFAKPLPPVQKENPAGLFGLIGIFIFLLFLFGK
jgi:hypothetical protein